KEALADRVLGECWDLYVQAETDETGELELLLRPQDLSLLVGKNRGTLNNFAERYNAKIDLSRRKNLLRFTADQVTCFRLTKDLEAVLGNIRHVDFDLSPMQPLLRKKPGGRRPLEKESVRWIAEITGTEIHESDDGQRLLIYYIGPSTNFADDARRLLLSLIGRANALPSVLRQYSISPVSAALCPMNPIEGLSWMDQRQQWSRWRCASSKLTVENSSVAKKANIGFEMNTEGKALLDQVGGFLRRGMVDMTKATARSDIPTWLEHTQHRTDAVIGHVLHSTADGIPIQALEDVQNNKSTGRTFATNAPGVLPVLNALPPIFNEPKQAIHLRMTPSPWTSFGLGGAAAFPQIEMRIVFDAETQMPSLRMLNAVTDERVSDLMLPQNMADLRFISRTSLGYAAAQVDSNVTAYLANASLKVTGKGRLGAPPTLQMRIPSRILRKGSQVAKAFSEGGEDVEMEYLFAGLDFREYIQYDLADHIMTYTKIEGGITGGRRSELLLHKTPSKEISDNTNDDSTGFDQDFAQLFQLAYKVVSVLDNREFGRSPNSIRRALLSPMRPASTDKGAQNGV
ncbi:MAG: hypothetical protein M1830_004133, partial [Pleopsidium flavum]